MTQPHTILYASELYQAWLSALKEEADLTSHHQAQAMMRAVLLELRELMTTDQVLDFAHALPHLPRGIFLEDWRPRKDPPDGTSPQDLLARVRAALSLHHSPPDSIVQDVFSVLATHSDPAAASRLQRALPAPLRPLWPSATSQD